MLQDQVLEEKESTTVGGQLEAFGRVRKRLCLVLDCLCPHDYSNKTADLINLQHYVIKEKKLSEKEAVYIFFDIVRIVQDLHDVSCASLIFVMKKHYLVFQQTLGTFGFNQQD